MSKFSLPKKTDESKWLSEEVGNAAVIELLNYYEIEIEDLPDQGQRDAMDAVAAKLSRFYRMGLLENKRDDGVLKVVQHLQNPPEGNTNPTLIYGRMTGGYRLAMDGFKENQRFAATQALMAALCGLPPSEMKKLTGNDLSAMECLSTVFRQA
jgi:hypothetical protein